MAAYPDRASYVKQSLSTTGVTLLPAPARPINYGIKANTLIFTASSGYEQRRSIGTPRRTFDLTYPILTLVQYQALRDFFLTNLNVGSFYWTDPVENVEYLVRFDQDTFQGQQKYHGPKGACYEVSVRLLQVFA